MTTIKKIEVLDYGVLIKTESGTIDRTIVICTDPDFCPSSDEGMTKVEFARGAYDNVTVLLPGKTGDCQAALDIAADCLADNDVAFDHFDEDDAIQMERVDEDGVVIDAINAGNAGDIYIDVDKFNIYTIDTFDFVE